MHMHIMEKRNYTYSSIFFGIGGGGGMSSSSSILGGSGGDGVTYLIIPTGMPLSTMAGRSPNKKIQSC